MQECTPELKGLITGSQAMAVEGDKIYLHRGEGGVEIIQKTPGGEFISLSVLMDSAFRASGSPIIVSASLVAAVVNDWKSVMLIDVSDPASPVIIETIQTLPGDPEIRSIGLDGTTLFIMTNNWFRTYDVSNPSAPVQLANRNFIGTHFGFEVGDGFVITQRQGTLKIYDVSDPSAPLLATTIPGRFFTVDGDQLFAGDTSAGQLWIKAYDLAGSLTSPVLLGSATDPFPMGFLSISSFKFVDGKLLIPVDEQKSYNPSVMVWDVSDPTQMSELYHVGLFDALMAAVPGLFQVADFDGETVFLSDGQLWAYDDLAIDLQMAHRFGTPAIRPIMKRNGNLIVWDRGRILVGPDAPIDQFIAVSTLELFQSYPSVDDYTAFFADSPDGYLYVCLQNPHGTAADDLTVHSIDLDAPGGPVLVDSEFVFLGEPRDMVYVDGVLYIYESRFDQILVVETLPGGNLGTITAGASSVFSSSTAGYFKAGDGALYAWAYVFDLTNPLAPTLATTITGFTSRPPLAIVGDHMYGNLLGGGGYDVYDLSNPLSPIKENGTSVPLPAGATFHAESEGILYFVSGDQMITVDVRDSNNQYIRETTIFTPNGSSPLADGRESFIIDTSLFFTDLVGSERVSEFDIGSCMVADCPADLTGDGTLNFVDVSAFVAAFTNQDPAADFSGDGTINFVDVSAFVAAFQAGCP